jgi:hypothetical protein
MIGGVTITEAAGIVVADLRGLEGIKDPRLRSIILEELSARSIGEGADDLVCILEEVVSDLRLH